MVCLQIRFTNIMTLLGACSQPYLKRKGWVVVDHKILIAFQ